MNQILSKRLDEYVELKIKRGKDRKDVLDELASQVNRYPIICLFSLDDKYTYYHLTESQQLDQYLSTRYTNHEMLMLNSRIYVPDGLCNGVPQYREVSHHTMPSNLTVTNIKDPWCVKAIPDFWQDYMAIQDKKAK